MPGSPNKLSQFWQELKRRKVVRVITVYAAAAFVILELVDIVSPSLGLPDWTLNFIIVLLCVGFILAIVLSWIYDITPEGIEKTRPEKEAATVVPEKPSGIKVWKIATYISVVIIIGLLVFNIAMSRKQSSDISKPEQSIAVLPFEDMSPQKDQEYFCDGITEEIINALTHIEGLRVIARTSTFSFKGKQEDIRDIGNKLNVETLLEGSVRKEGNRLRITAQLIKVEDGSHIWLDRYDRDIESIFDIQDEISLAVAENLKVRLLGEEKAAVVKRPTKNLTAYDFYLRGNEYYWRSFNQQDFNTAISIYQKAIELDPKFALAYTRISMSHLFLYWFYHDRSEDRLMKSKKAIDAAIKIEPELIEANIALGLYYYWGLLDYSEALKQFDIALNQSPQNSECIFWIAAIHRRLGDWEKAKEHFKKAFELDPRNSRYAHQTGHTYDLLRDYAEALYYYDIAIMLRPDWVVPYNNKCYIYLKWNSDTLNARSILKDANNMIPSAFEHPNLKHKLILLELFDGNYQEAIKYLPLVKSEVIEDQFFLVPWYQYYAQIYGLMDSSELKYAHYDSSRLMLEDKLIWAPEDSRLYSSLGIAYAGLGRKKEAIEAGQKAVELLSISKDPTIGTYRVEDLARIYIMVGEHEKAIELIELLLSIPGDLTTNLLQFDPVWKPLENNPRYLELLETYSNN